MWDYFVLKVQTKIQKRRKSFRLLPVLFSVVLALLTLLCVWPWLYAHAHERKQMKVMLVSSIKTNCGNHHKRNDTLITFQTLPVLPPLLWLSSPFYIKWISIICLFKTWISNYCQLISRYYQMIGDFLNSLKHWMI